MKVACHLKVACLDEADCGKDSFGPQISRQLTLNSSPLKLPPKSSGVVLPWRVITTTHLPSSVAGKLSLTMSLSGQCDSVL